MISKTGKSILNFGSKAHSERITRTSWHNAPVRFSDNCISTRHFYVSMPTLNVSSVNLSGFDTLSISTIDVTCFIHLTCGIFLSGVAELMSRGFSAVGMSLNRRR